MTHTAPAVACAFERDHSRPCPVCRSVRSGTTVLQNTPAMQVGHVDHLALAVATDAAHAVRLYAERGFHLFEDEVIHLAPADRAALDAWAATADPLPAAFVALAHVASVGPLVVCRRCHLALDDSAILYAPGTFVGLDCEGTPPGGVR